MYKVKVKVLHLKSYLSKIVSTSTNGSKNGCCDCYTITVGLYHYNIVTPVVMFKEHCTVVFGWGGAIF